MSVQEQFREFTSMIYAEQAKAFLNAFWDEHGGDAEKIWNWVHTFIELDFEKGKEGSDLDEFNAHRFLERLGETRTIKELRSELASIDMDFNRRMALIEYLLFNWKHNIEDFVSRPQGGQNAEELAQAQRLLDEVSRALAECQRTADEADRTATAAREREANAIAREDDAVAREAEAAEAEKPFRIAQEELEAALAELHAQEEAFNTRKTELETKSQDTNVGVVTRNKAANELAQLLSEDPLPLRQAKLTTEAAERKADKARAPFREKREIAEAARAEAESSRKQAESARADAEAAKAEADKAVDEVNERYREAEAYLQELLSQPQEAFGSIWWMERELAEAKKYMPGGKRK